MTTHDSFDHRPDPTVGRLLRDYLSVQGHDAFVARVREAARRGRRGSQPAEWELLARWFGPGSTAAAAILVAALVGIGATERGSSIVSLAEALGPAEAPPELLAANAPPDPQVLLSRMPEAPALIGDPAHPSTRKQHSKLVVQVAPFDADTAHPPVDHGAIVGVDPLDTALVRGRPPVRQQSEKPLQVLVPDPDVAVHRPEPDPHAVRVERESQALLTLPEGTQPDPHPGRVERESQALLTLPEGTLRPAPPLLGRDSQDQSGYGQRGQIQGDGKPGPHRRAGDKRTPTLP
jgi:hypothetical protein